MDSRAIGIFDSGVGGLTVFSEIKNRLPNENLIYLGDTKHFPYGNKTKKEIIAYSIKNTEYLIKKGVKIIVVACGTATSQAIEILRNRFSLPIIGIIEPTIQYVKKKKINKIGVIATEGTIRSNAWEIELKKEINNIQVINKACPMLATIAEEGRAKSNEGRLTIKQYMREFKSKKIDKIILGCTHYPIYKELIMQELGYPVQLIDTGCTVAEYLADYLNKQKLLNMENKRQDIIYLTKPEEQFKSIAKNILKCDEILQNII